MSTGAQKCDGCGEMRMLKHGRCRGCWRRIRREREAAIDALRMPARPAARIELEEAVAVNE